MSAAALAILIAPPMNAQSRKGAPIKYAGQSNQTSTYYNPSNGAGVSSNRYSGGSYQIASSPMPDYGRPVQQAETPRTKRIEFRYPDQPNVVHSSDGSQKTKTSQPPIKYSSRQSALEVQEIRQFASVGAPTPIAPPKPTSPVLHQPYAIEEVAMVDLPAAAQPTDPSIFEPVAQPGFLEQGLASWYGDEFHGQPTANGEIFDMTALTAAHPTLPLPSLVQVTNNSNNREIVVRVNDRGPFVPNRMIDVSKRAADELGFLVDGEADVTIRYLGPAPIASQTPAWQNAPIAQQPVGEPQPIIPQSYPQPRMDPIPNPVGQAYFIQAGSFSRMENAQRLSEDLSGSLPVDVVMANVHGADFFRVLIGPYDSRRDADAMRNQLDASAIVDGVVITAN